MKYTLGLDISSVSSGFAVLDEEMKLVEYGILKVKKNADHPEKLCQYEDELNKLLKKYEFNKVCVEEVWKGRNTKVHKILSLYHGVSYALIYRCLNLNPVVSTTAEIRKTIEQKTKENIISETKQVGKRKKYANPAQKEKVFEAIKKMYSLEEFNFDDHNDITDAIAVAVHGWQIKEEKYGCKKTTKERKRKSKGDGLDKLVQGAAVQKSRNLKSVANTKNKSGSN